MNAPRFELKVGIFITIALTILAALMVNFSKSVSLFTQTYQLKLRASNVGGIKSSAAVLMSGVPIGNVATVELAPNGKSVIVHLRLLAKFPVRRDATFIIEQSGFLGDQYIAVYPSGGDKAEFLADGATVDCEEPLNMQEVARAASGFIKRLDDTVKRLDQIIARVDSMVLNEKTLGDLSNTVVHLRLTTENAVQVVRHVDDVIATNAPVLNQTLTNLSHFPNRLNSLADELTATVVTNRGRLDASMITLASTMTNLEHTSQSAQRLMADVEAGKGLAGGLLRDDGLKTDMQNLIGNLTLLSSNLNKYGLLYKPRQFKVITNVFPYEGKR